MEVRWFVQPSTERLESPAFVYCTSKMAICGNSPQVVTATIFFRDGAAPVRVTRCPAHIASRTLSRSTSCKVKSRISFPATVRDSEGAKSPIAISLPSNLATTRLCSISLNSMRIFLPSAWALCDAEGLDQLASHTANPTTSIFHDFIGMMTLSPKGENDLRIPGAASDLNRMIDQSNAQSGLRFVRKRREPSSSSFW